MGSPGRALRRFVTIAVAACLLLALPAEAQDDAKWRALAAEFDEKFDPLPIKKLFDDPMKGLKLNRRAPFTGAKRKEIEADRNKASLAREKVLAKRKEREGVLKRIGAVGGAVAAKRLMQAWRLQVRNIALARKNADAHEEAGRIDINPGVDPGGHYWRTWFKRSELPAARRVLADEERVQQIALDEAARIMTPEVREWIVGHARESDDPRVRERMVIALSASADRECQLALDRVFAEEKEVWARVMIVLACEKPKTAATAALLLRALSDEAWPVRSASIETIRKRGLRDAATIDALIECLAAEPGRLRLEARYGLCSATGQPFGLDAGVWKLWWSAERDGWKAPARAAKVPRCPDTLPEFCGYRTASKRIVFVVSRGGNMTKPTRRRPYGNEETVIDTAQAIAAFELDRTLSLLPSDALFTVIAMGDEPSLWSKTLRAPDARERVARFVRKFKAEGGSRLGPALDMAFRLGLPKSVDDVALAGIGDVDTIFIVGGYLPKDAGFKRTLRYRRVVVRAVKAGL